MTEDRRDSMRHREPPAVRRALSVICLLSSVLFAACGTARRGAPLQAPFAPAAEEEARGEGLYMRFCNGCHPGGEGGLGLNNKPLPQWAIRFQVRRGLGAMPAFSDEVIPADDLDALVAYMKALRRHDESGSDV